MNVSFPRCSGRRRRNERLSEVLPFLFTSPGLKHLCIGFVHRVNESTYDQLEARWKDLIVCDKPKSVSKLDSLKILWPGLKDGTFELAAAADLSQLRTLDLGLAGSDDTARVAGLFPNLERLFIDFIYPSSASRLSDAEFDETILGISAFRPLKCLSIKGIRTGESLLKLIQHHGPSLKGLALESVLGGLHRHPKISPSAIEEMATLCPNLQEMRLQIPRSEGNQAECEIYKALGNFRKLHSLFLDLFFDARPQPPQWDMIKVTTERDALRRTFINAAMNESLALQIWTMIKNNNPHLKNLRLLLEGACRFPPDELYLQMCLARSYLLTHYNLESPGSPLMEQVGKNAWDVRHEMKDLGHAIRRDGKLVFSDGVVSVLDELWPRLSEESDWWTGWTSFPLQPEVALKHQTP